MLPNSHGMPIHLFMVSAQSSNTLLAVFSIMAGPLQGTRGAYPLLAWLSAAATIAMVFNHDAICPQARTRWLEGPPSRSTLFRNGSEAFALKTAMLEAIERR